VLPRRTRRKGYVMPPYNMMVLVMRPVYDIAEEEKLRDEMAELLGDDYLILPADYTLPRNQEDDDAPAA
jgi:hypothetical protein